MEGLTVLPGPQKQRKELISYLFVVLVLTCGFILCLVIFDYVLVIVCESYVRIN